MRLGRTHSLPAVGRTCPVRDGQGRTSVGVQCPCTRRPCAPRLDTDTTRQAPVNWTLGLGCSSERTAASRVSWVDQTPASQPRRSTRRRVQSRRPTLERRAEEISSSSGACDRQQPSVASAVAAGARTAGISAALQARPPGRPPLSGSLIGCAASAPARGCHGDGVGRQMARQQQQQPGHDTGRQVGLSTRNADESCDDMSSLAHPMHRWLLLLLLLN